MSPAFFYQLVRISIVNGTHGRVRWARPVPRLNPMVNFCKRRKVRYIYQRFCRPCIPNFLFGHITLIPLKLRLPGSSRWLCFAWLRQEMCIISAHDENFLFVTFGEFLWGGKFQQLVFYFFVGFMDRIKWILL